MLRSFGGDSATKGVRRRALDRGRYRRARLAGRAHGRGGAGAAFRRAGQPVRSGRGRSLLIGSHSDTQPEGGWLDGALGVIAALEIARAAREAGGPRYRSRIFRMRKAASARSPAVRSGRASCRWRMPTSWSPPMAQALARRGRPLASVWGISSIRAGSPAFWKCISNRARRWTCRARRWGLSPASSALRQVQVTVRGQQNHAGTTPMAHRRDAFSVAARIATALPDRFANIVTPQSVWTIGHIVLHPGASSVVPGRADFSLQWRDIDPIGWTGWRRAIMALCPTWRPKPDARSPPRGCAMTLHRCRWMRGCRRRCLRPPRRSRRGAGGRCRRGRLHDASNLAGLMPVGMLFVPSIGGISHDFAEDTAEADLVTGLQVLADAAARLG
jgi:beta-ureidopropionase / N-carbamoyl-L-amino-acid hydrolase